MGRKKKTSTPKSVKYPWLTKAEAANLSNGGYFDNEGAEHNSLGCVRCTAVVKSTGNRCKNFAVEGELFCHIHGGLNGRRVNNKMRIYSAFIEDPALKKVYENNLDSDEIQGAKEELALLRMLLAKLLDTADLKNAKDIRNVASVISEIRALVKDCTNTEIRLGQLIDIGKVTIVVKQLANIVAKYVKDEDIIAKIANDFDNVIWPATGASTPQPVRETPSREIPAISGSVLPRNSGI